MTSYHEEETRLLPDFASDRIRASFLLTCKWKREREKDEESKAMKRENSDK